MVRAGNAEEAMSKPTAAILSALIAAIVIALYAGLWSRLTCSDGDPCECPRGAPGMRVCGQAANDPAIQPYTHDGCFCPLNIPGWE
jgi:hypothetical protein